MSRFSVGDRVISVVDAPDGNKGIHIGSTGVVCRTSTGRFAIYWDEDVGGHSCEGYCPNGHGWWVGACDVELDDETDDEPFDFNEDEFNKLVFGEEVAHGN